MDHPLSRHLTSMAFNNAWSNHRLLRAVGRLSQDDFVATRTSFFPSIHATLNHVVTVDWYYVDALERGLRGEQPDVDAARRYFDPEHPFATCAELDVAQRSVDRRLVDLCRTLTDDRCETPIGLARSRGILHESASRLLAHLFQHQIHHRGQVHAMLAGTHVKPPQLDELFCANEAHKRASDLSELGWTEADLWAG